MNVFTRITWTISAKFDSKQHLVNEIKVSSNEGPIRISSKKTNKMILSNRRTAKA